MTNAETRAVTKDRLAKWAERLGLENATPALLVGIGHGSKSGQIVVVSVEDLTNEYISGFLRYALNSLGETP